MEPLIKLLFDIVIKPAPLDENEAKQIADEAKEYIHAIVQLETARRSIYQGLSKPMDVSHDALLETTHEKGFTLLMYAAAHGHRLIVQALLEANASLQHTDEEWGKAAINFAAEHNHTQIVHLLLKAKADPNKMSNKGNIPLCWAAYKGNIEMVQMLLTAKADPNKEEKNGETALFWAAGEDFIEIVQRLLAVKADIHHLDKTGNTALMAAAYTGSVASIELLLQANVNINHQSRYETTALDYAIGEKYLETVSYLLKHKASILRPEKLFSFLKSYDPRHPEILTCLNFLCQQNDDKAIHEYRDKLAKVSESLKPTREALDEALGKKFPTPLLEIIRKLDAPLYRLNDHDTLFGDKKHIDEIQLLLSRQLVQLKNRQ